MCFACALPVLAVVLAGESAHKGLSAFLYAGLSLFLYGFRDLFAGLSAFFCVSPFAWLARWLAPLGGNCGYNYHYSHLSNHTGAIIPLVTITKVTIPCVIDRHYCLRRAINKSNNKCNVNLS